MNKWQDFCKLESPAFAATRLRIGPACAHPRAPSQAPRYFDWQPGSAALLPTDLPIHSANLRVSPLPIGWLRRPAVPPGTVPRRAGRTRLAEEGWEGWEGRQGRRRRWKRVGLKRRGNEGGRRPVQRCAAIGSREASRLCPTLGATHAIGWYWTSAPPPYLPGRSWPASGSRPPPARGWAGLARGWAEPALVSSGVWNRVLM